MAESQNKNSSKICLWKGHRALTAFRTEPGAHWHARPCKFCLLIITFIDIDKTTALIRKESGKYM